MEFMYMEWDSGSELMLSILNADGLYSREKTDKSWL